jgi:hypothetical protein
VLFSAREVRQLSQAGQIAASVKREAVFKAKSRVRLDSLGQFIKFQIV